MTGNKQSARLQRFSEYRDPYAPIEYRIAAIVRVSRCGDPALALKASQWQIEYAESLRNGKRQTKEEDLSRTLQD